MGLCIDVRGLLIAEEFALRLARHADPKCADRWQPSRPSGRGREYGSASSGPAMALSAVHASSVVSAKIATQSSVRQAGTTPNVETRPRLGFNPTMLLRLAGTRPEPAVSVPSASGTMPAETATADPELEPPGISGGIARIARHAVGRAHADQPGGELIKIGLADDDSAGGAQASDHRGVLVRLIGIGGAGCGGEKLGNVDIVLDRDRDAVKRAIRPCAGQGTRFGDRLRLIAQADEQGRIAIGAQPRIAARDRFGR